jgi:feruloyl-CoA synthase
VLLDQPPSLDAGELTDKGSVSQKAVLDNRAVWVEGLYAARPAAHVIVLEAGA